jgi:RNA-directed DNA polymerase
MSTQIDRISELAKEDAKRQFYSMGHMITPESLYAAFRGLRKKHVCARSRKGKFTVHVRTMKKRFRRGLTAIAEWCQENRHMPVEEQQKTLNAKLRGHYQYYGRPTNYQSLWRFFREVRHIWRKWLSRRTRGNGMIWEKYAAILRKHPLLLPRIQHSWNGAGSHV